MPVKIPDWVPVEGWDAKRDEWVAAVDQLVTEAEAWAHEQNWLVHRGSKTFTDEGLGTYEVPMLMMHCPQGALNLNPGGCNLIGPLGGIDFRVYPSYETVRILHTATGWRFVTDPPTRVLPWSKEAFLEIASELALKR